MNITSISSKEELTFDKNLMILCKNFCNELYVVLIRNSRKREYRRWKNFVFCVGLYISAIELYTNKLLFSDFRTGRI